jgi:thioredoxin reductase (NADPH)
MRHIRFILIGAVHRVAWASSLRAFMQQLGGPTSAFTFTGTFGIIIPAGTTVGALLGWAEYQRHTGHQYHAASELEAKVVSGQNAVVVGGANSAGQAALFLARHAGQVHVLIRRDDLRDTMSTYLAQRLTHHERVTIHPRSELSAVHGTSRLSALNWRDHVRERDVQLDAAGLVLMIGADPSTTWLHEVGVELDPKGFVITRDGFVTSVPGVFAVGDVRAGSVKRVASAVGEGSVVISAVHSYLAGTKTS